MLQTYNLNLEPGLGNVVVHCSQYDKDYRVVQFNLFNGNALYSIPDNSTVLVRGTKTKDNTGFEYECEYDGSVVTFEIKDQMTVYAGKYPAEIRIVRDATLIGSANFMFNVEPSPLLDNTVISETQLPLLESALEAASEAEQYKIDAHSHELEAQAWAEGKKGDDPVESTDPQYQNYAKHWSEVSKDHADDASASATDAQGYANQADLSAQSSEAEALKSEGYAIGQQGGTDVEEGSPYWRNNAKWYAQLAEQGAEHSGYAFFDVDQSNGQMYVTITEELDSDLVFHVNENLGILEVTYL